MPVIAPDVFVAETAVVIGDVEIGSGSSVWYGAVIRGDSAPIRIGERTNIQDGSVVHCDGDAPTTIGDDVTVGHLAIVHGTTVEDGALIGMGSTILSHCRIGAGAIVAAGALLTEGTVVEPNTLVMGVPAKPRRELTETDNQATAENAMVYFERSRDYLAERQMGSQAG
jgi:carbonic anhydrase/acetyltransferase-like protein (isoleucine patch superfamily)